MTERCRNLCREPQIFPRSVENRPGLPRIGYRIGSYSNMLAAMLARMDHEEVLRNWTHREGDDPGIALLEGASILGDILTFYQDLYANEAYLRTAAWRESLDRMVRLTGYRLAPGIAGSASFAVEVKEGSPVTVPAGFPVKAQLQGLDRKVEFETTASLTAYPGLNAFPLYRPSVIPPFSRRVTGFSLPASELEGSGPGLEPGDTLLLLESVPGPVSNGRTVTVKEVSEHLDRTIITITGHWDAGNGLSSVHMYRIGRTFRHFGHAASRETIRVESGVAVPGTTSFLRRVRTTTASSGSTVIQPSLGRSEIPLDTAADDIAPGTPFIIRGIGGSHRFMVRSVSQTRPASMTWGSLTGQTTMITLDGSMDPAITTVDIRDLTLYETMGPRLRLYAIPTEDHDTDGSRLDVFLPGDDYLLLEGRKLILMRDDGLSMETTVSINRKAVETGRAGGTGNTAGTGGSAEAGRVGWTDGVGATDGVSGTDWTSGTDRTIGAGGVSGMESGNPPRLRPLFLTIPPSTGGFSLDDFPLLYPGVTAFGNTFSATQGKSGDPVILGNGDGRQAFQSFMLPDTPLTYLTDPASDPPETPELEVFVDDILWTRVGSLFGSGPDDEVYIVREDDEGYSWVQFGDGITGKRPPSGVGNVMARYRTGSGAYGTLSEGTIPTPGRGLTGIDTLHLPGPVTGGCAPETMDHARVTAPGKIRSLGRLVSLEDFESEAMGIAGVSRAQARWQVVDGIPSMVLTVLMDNGREGEFSKLREIMASLDRSRGPRRFPVMVLPGSRRNIYLDVIFGIHPRHREDVVKEAILQALGMDTNDGDCPSGTQISPADTSRDHGSSGLFREHLRQFGQPEFASRVTGVVL